MSPASQHTVDDNDVHIVPYIESEQLSSVTKNSDSTSKVNRYKIGIKAKLVNHASEKKRKVLFDRTNLGSEAGAILHKAILEPVKHIDLPQNPFSINRSYEEDLLPSRGSEHSIDKSSNQHFDLNDQSEVTAQINMEDKSCRSIEFEDDSANESVASDGFLKSESIVSLWRKELELEIQFKKNYHISLCK